MTRTIPAVLALSVCLALPARAQDLTAVQSLSLSEAIAVAVAREPSVRAASADLESARAVRLQAGLRPNPTVSVERRQEPGGHDRSTEAAIEWPLDLFRRPARIAVADAEIAVAALEAADARRRLAADVAAAYGTAAAALREVGVGEEVLAAASGQLDVLRARAAQGAIPTLDRDVLDVDVRQMQASRLVQAARAEAALIRLKRLLGLAPEATLRITQTLEDLVADQGMTGTAAGLARPDLQASAARVVAADARIAAARREARPEVTVFGAYMRMDAGFAQRGFSAAGLLEPVRGQFNYVTGGAMVTVPLWNRQQGTVAAATAARQAADARAEAARLTAAMELSEARVVDEQARKVVALYQDGIRPLARRNLETVRETYGLGRATVFDVLAEQRRYLEAERAYTDALREAFAARVNVGRATGALR